MLGQYYYHEILRKTIIGFGTLFNNIQLRHQDANGKDISAIKVPLAYGPAQKFLARIEQGKTNERDIAITLPRMSFEMTGIEYDATRKTGITQTFKTTMKPSGSLKKVFMPVPYTLQFSLSIFTKLNDDALQFIDQILPYFQPSFNVTIDLVSSIGEKRDIPVTLNNISFSDEYEGDFTTRRALIYTLTFSAKTQLFGAIADSPDGIIKKVMVDIYQDTNTRTARKSVRYTTTPKAKKDYNDDGAITAADDPLVEAGDDFGFNETTSIYLTPTKYSPSEGKDVDG